MRSSLHTFIILALFGGLTKAGLYPTEPIANTVFHGGQWNTISWIDSLKSQCKTPLTDMSAMDIELWIDDNQPRYITTLATDVDPRSYTQNVYISAELWRDSSNFFLILKSTEPPAKVYTANFAMADMTGNRTALSDGEVRQAASTHSASSATGSAARSVTPSSLSVAASNTGANDLVTVTMETTAPSADYAQATKAGAVAAMENGAASGGRQVRKPSMKFNLVFVFFPALFGLSLAL